MRLNSKVTWGLAWTGLAIVLAVPSADFFTGQAGSGGKALITSTTEPVKTASVGPDRSALPAPAATDAPAPVETAVVTTRVTPKGITITPAGSKPPADPVDAYVSSGKPLPDYISDRAAEAPAETQVAAIDPAPIVVAPPTPFPAWARPRATATVVSSAPSSDPVVIVDEEALTGSIDRPAGPTPPSAIVDDSANWEEETLRQYLERRGILEGAGNSSATVTQGSSDYDPDGFYLSDGPNNDGAERRRRILRMLRESGQDPDGFTLF